MREALSFTYIVCWVRLSLLHVVFHSVVHVRRSDDDCITLVVVGDALQLAELGGACIISLKKIQPDA